MERVVKFPEIEEFFKTYEFSDDIIELSAHETILNIKKYVTSHIVIIKSNLDKSEQTRKRLKPYWDRLLHIYKLLNINWNESGKK